MGGMMKYFMVLTACVYVMSLPLTGFGSEEELVSWKQARIISPDYREMVIEDKIR